MDLFNRTTSKLCTVFLSFFLSLLLVFVFLWLHLLHPSLLLSFILLMSSHPPLYSPLPLFTPLPHPLIPSLILVLVNSFPSFSSCFSSHPSLVSFCTLSLLPFLLVLFFSSSPSSFGDLWLLCRASADVISQFISQAVFLSHIHKYHQQGVCEMRETIKFPSK